MPRVALLAGTDGVGPLRRFGLLSAGLGLAGYLIFSTSALA